MATILDLIAKNDRDIALFRGYAEKLRDKPGTRQHVGDLEGRIRAAERSNAILRTAR
jgi:hypothetical protein